MVKAFCTGVGVDPGTDADADAGTDIGMDVGIYVATGVRTDTCAEGLDNTTITAQLARLDDKVVDDDNYR